MTSRPATTPTTAQAAAKAARPHRVAAVAAALPRRDRRRQVRRQRHGRRRPQARLRPGHRLPALRRAPARRRARRRPADLGDARPARHRERVQRRLPGHDARGHGRRARWCSPARSAASSSASSTSTARSAVGISGEDAGLFTRPPPRRRSSTASERRPRTRRRRRRGRPAPRCSTSSTPGASPSSRRRARRRPAGQCSTSTPTRPRRRSPSPSAPRSSSCSPMSRASTPTGPNRDSLVVVITPTELRGAAAEPRVGHDPQDGGVPRGRRRAACRKAAIIDGREPHSILLEIFTHRGHRHRGGARHEHRTQQTRMPCATRIAYAASAAALGRHGRARPRRGLLRLGRRRHALPRLARGHRRQRARARAPGPRRRRVAAQAATARARLQLLRHAAAARARRAAARASPGPGGTGRSIFGNSGAEANEAAFKLARRTGPHRASSRSRAPSTAARWAPSR